MNIYVIVTGFSLMLQIKLNLHILLKSKLFVIISIYSRIGVPEKKKKTVFY